MTRPHPAPAGRRTARCPTPLHRAALALALLACTGAGLAAGPASATDAASRYRQERAACLSGQTTQDRATCLREAGAAWQEARRGRPAAVTDHAANALRRCDGLPDSDRIDCIARMHGQGSVSGSVGGGGLYRELVTRDTLPADPPPPKAP